MKMMQLSWDLQKASLAARTGTGVVSGLAIFSLTVCSWIAFIVAGGTWMFWQRKAAGLQLPVPIHESRQNDDLLTTYVALAFIACAFLVPAIFALTSQAAVLGASGRERRLAALRLIGLTSGDITRITAFETGMQAVFGIGLGFLLSVFTAPIGARFSFQGSRLSATDLYLPWWGYILVALVLLALAVLSSVIGMQRVMVSPLGVARREIPRALKWWRLAITLAAIFGGLFWLRLQTPSTESGFLIGMGIAVFIMVAVLNFGMPLVLQLWFRLMGLLPGTQHFVATRRIFTDGKAAWRRCAATAFYGVLVGVLVLSPRGNDEFSTMFQENAEVGMMFRDLNSGVMITLVIGFIIAAVATLLGQASDVFETASLTRALSALGVPRRFHFVVATFQIMGPIVLVSLCGFVLGGGIMFAMFGGAGDMDVPARALNASIFLLAGWALTLIALVAVEPLRSRVLTTGGRKND
ncbi:FtsX-like permease family protein [Corynebacterium kalinowskii]|uniref:FtsX-like permease family protein n=1 Tax=Corynebacterium kalinowskii TaxID=2675216 RepID=A0A6B8VX26_9CORY|nr:FtsX-like permease family protein [Corynebacterium kalinowskii]QGU03256.1 FtsX-like permease family protein [Corynebacterium kalinowskii]